MSFKWKIPAVAAGGAFLLSLLLGAAGRVAFGTVILRAFIWGGVFASLSLGVDLLLRKYLPELFYGEVDEAAAGQPSVDITLEEENPVTAARAGDGEERGYAEDACEEEETQPDDAESEISVDDMEQRDQLVRADEPAGDSDMNGTDQSEEGGEGEFLDSQSFETALGSSGVTERAEASQAANIDFLGIDEDPATVAKAVRTFMKKDQEG